MPRLAVRPRYNSAMSNRSSGLSSELVGQLKDLSIRARMAMAIECLTPVLEHYELPEDLRQDLLDLLWRFVEEYDLAQWDEDRRKNGTLDIVGWFVESGKDIPAASPVRSLPRFVLEMICETESLGTDDLYGAVIGYSEHTLERLVRVLSLAAEHGFPIPSITRFLFSAFSRSDEWGRPTSRTSFSES